VTGPPQGQLVVFARPDDARRGQGTVHDWSGRDGGTPRSVRRRGHPRSFRRGRSVALGQRHREAAARRDGSAAGWAGDAPWQEPGPACATTGRRPTGLGPAAHPRLATGVDGVRLQRSLLDEEPRGLLQLVMQQMLAGAHDRQPGLAGASPARHARPCPRPATDFFTPSPGPSSRAVSMTRTMPTDVPYPDAQLHFGVFFQGVKTNHWTIWSDRASGSQIDRPQYRRVGPGAERGLFDAFFLGEGLGCARWDGGKVHDMGHRRQGLTRSRSSPDGAVTEKDRPGSSTFNQPPPPVKRGRADLARRACTGCGTCSPTGAPGGNRGHPPTTGLGPAQLPPGRIPRPPPNRYHPPEQSHRGAPGGSGTAGNGRAV